MPDGRRTRTPSHPPASTESWTVDTIRALGLTTDLVTAGRILGISRNAAYALARGGAFPVPVIKAGTRYGVPVAALLALLLPTTPPT